MAGRSVVFLGVGRTLHAVDRLDAEWMDGEGEMHLLDLPLSCHRQP